MLSLWPGNKWLLGPEFKLHMSLNLKIRVGLKVLKNKEENLVCEFTLCFRHFKGLHARTFQNSKHSRES